MSTMPQPDSPPQWLLSVARDHAPLNTITAGMICKAEACLQNLRPWTPEHLVYEIHNCLAEAIQKLITEGRKTNAADEL